MIGIVVSLVLAIVLSIPVWIVARSERRATWASAVVMGTLMTTIGIILIAEIPSRLLYLFSAQYDAWAKKFSFVRWALAGVVLGGTDRYIVTSDIIVNTLQGVLFVIIVALIYVWGEKQRKAGRFKS